MARMTEPEETFSERMLGFSIPSRDARGRLVRLDPPDQEQGHPVRRRRAVAGNDLLRRHVQLH